jgi:hypothetical protein
MVLIRRTLILRKVRTSKKNLPTRTETQEKRKALPFRLVGRLSKEGECVTTEQPGGNADQNEEGAKRTGADGEEDAEQKAGATDQRDRIEH